MDFCFRGAVWIIEDRDRSGDCLRMTLEGRALKVYRFLPLGPNWTVSMQLGKRQSLAPAGITSEMSLTRPFADAAFLRNLRVPSREINPARKILRPEMIIAPSVSTSNQRSAPLRCRAMRLPCAGYLRHPFLKTRREQHL